MDRVSHDQPTYVHGRHDLPQDKSPRTFRISDGHKTVVLTWAHTKRQVLELLMQGTLYCGSPVRLSEIVAQLRKDGVPIVTERLLTVAADGTRSRYGFYRLDTHFEVVRWV